MRFYRRDDLGERLAWLVSTIFHPAVLVPVTGLLTLFRSGLDISGAVFFASLWVLCSVLPTLTVASFVSETGFRVHRRAERWKPELAAFLMSLFTLGVSYWLGAPELVLEAGVLLAVFIPVWSVANRFDKLSVHVGAAVVSFTVLSGTYLSSAVSVICTVLVVWSRLVLDAHTRAQVLEGALLGALIAVSFISI